MGTVSKVVLIPEAARELAEAYAWYEARRKGLGEDFLRCVMSCVDGIQRNPERHELVNETYRRALVRRFPYAVFFEHTGATATIYSVFHCSQDPEKWQSRLP